MTRPRERLAEPRAHEMVAVDSEPVARGGIDVEAGEVHDPSIVVAHRPDDRKRFEHAFERRPSLARSAAATSANSLNLRARTDDRQSHATPANSPTTGMSDAATQSQRGTAARST